MYGIVSAPRSPTEWLIFAAGVFFVVSTVVFLTTGVFITSLRMGVSSTIISLGLTTGLVFLWRRFVPALTR